MISIQGIVLYSILLVLYYLVPKQWQKHLLLAADLLFAFSLGISTLVMLIILSLIVFFGVRGMADSTNKKSRVFALVMAVVLALFGIKYLSSFTEEITVFLGHIGIGLSSGAGIKPVQAVGISFYSLRLIGYTVDVYKGQKEERDILNFLLFTSFFPIFTAGPIEKSSRLMTEVSCYRAFDEQKVYRGFLMTLYGVFLKLVVADRLGVLVDEVYNDIGSYPGALCLIVIILYSFQIYADFAGYSYIAIGLSGMLGISIMDNFHRPYLAVSVRDFWRRWHISLSQWLRDYVYIPLGGNKKGLLRKELNIMITFLISGLWHGTGLNFIVWGGLHGLYQVVEDLIHSVRTGMKRSEEAGKNSSEARTASGMAAKSTDDIYSSIKRICESIGTFALVTIAWVFFRADSVSQALMVFGKIIEGPGFKSLANGEIFNLGLGPIQIFGLLAALVIIAVFEVMQEKQLITLDKITASPRLIRWTVSYIMIVWIVLAAVQLYGITEEAAFIYAAF